MEYGELRRCWPLMAVWKGRVGFLQGHEPTETLHAPVGTVDGPDVCVGNTLGLNKKRRELRVGARIHMKLGE